MPHEVDRQAEAWRCQQEAAARQRAEEAAAARRRASQREQLVKLARRLGELGSSGAQTMKASREQLGVRTVKVWEVGRQVLTSSSGNGMYDQGSSGSVRSVYRTGDGRFVVHNGRGELAPHERQSVTEAERRPSGYSRSAIDFGAAIEHLSSFIEGTTPANRR